LALGVKVPKFMDKVLPFPRLGPYELLLVLGEGATASVYLARDSDGMLVALKVLREHLRDDEVYVREFVREARLGSRIIHPNVGRVLGCREEDAALYIVLEYVPGVTLAALVRGWEDGAEDSEIAENSKGLPVPVATRIVVDLLRGLHAAHEAAPALVHRDVSPQNVVVGADGTTKLVDFGTAKAAESTGITGVGVVKGKLRYMAPEQLSGSPLDRRVDVWAAAVVWWEAIAGERLFHGAESAAVFEIVRGRIRPFPATVESPPEALLAVLASALRVAPDARPPSAAAFADAVEHAAKEANISIGYEAVVAAVDAVAGARLRARASSLAQGAITKP
jgi:serine/threonine-protein kinase